MDNNIATFILKSLLERAKISNTQTFLTSVEINALHVFLGDIEENIPSDRPMVFEPVDNFLPQILYPNPATIDDEHILCLDFGTSFSKAFACSNDGLDDDPELFDLSFGFNSAGDPKLLLPSELLIHDGEVFFGDAARAKFEVIEADQDRLIDGPKQYMTLGKDVSELQQRPLSKSKDPTGTFSQRDALVLFLAHLNLKAEDALKDRGLKLNLLRRYAHPAWDKNSTETNSKEMKRIMAEAIALSRLFPEEFHTHTSIEHASILVNEARAASDNDLPHALLSESVLEATAAGAGALMGTAARKREAYVVLDIGAGTTDVAGCICINNPNNERVKVSEVAPAAKAIRRAGNNLDNALLLLILEKSGLAPRTTEYERESAALRKGIRSLKEILFNDNFVVAELVSGDLIEISVEELTGTKAVISLFSDIREIVTDAAILVSGDDKVVNLVATGGGANLPIIQNLTDQPLTKNGKNLRLRLKSSIPKYVSDAYPNLIDPYPQLAVAVGGALPNLPQQINSISEGITDPGEKHLTTIYKS